MITFKNEAAFEKKNLDKKAAFKSIFSECTDQVSHQIVVSSLTIKYSTAILSGGGQWLAGGVQFVTVVTNADFKLDWFSRFLYHGGAVEDCTQTVLPPPLVLLKGWKETEERGKGKRSEV